MSALSKKAQFVLLGIVISTLMETQEGVWGENVDADTWFGALEELEAADLIRTFPSESNELIHLPGSAAFVEAFELFKADFVRVNGPEVSA